MTEATTGPLYDLWAKVYDRTFGAMVLNRQAAALDQMRLRPGDRVLDIGVGTGLMLARYRRDVTVIGMDLSEGMLSKAAVKRDNNGWSHCHLVRADAMFPPFGPASFDRVMISHTISVVSDPTKLLAWASSLLKPHGRIVLLNHFRSTRPVVAWFEKMLNPLFMKLGWRSDLLLEDTLMGLDLQFEYCFKTRAVDIWRIVVFEHKTHQPQPQIDPEVEAAASSGQLAISQGH